MGPGSAPAEASTAGRLPARAIVPLLSTILLATSTATALGQDGSATPSLVPVLPPPSAAPITSGAPVADDGEDDLWLRDATGLVRVDGVTGQRVGALDASVDHCAWQRTFGPGDGAMWLSSSGAPGYQDQMSQMMGVPVDPEERFCIGRFPIDGSEPQVWSVDLEPHMGLSVGSGAVVDGVLWLNAFLLPEQGGVLGGKNGALYRLDPAVGELEKVTRGVLDVAASNGTLYVVQDPKDTGWPRAGTVDPADGKIRKLEFGLKGYDSVTDVAAADDLVSFSGSRYDRKAKGSTPWRPQVLSVDPSTGTVIQSARGKVGQSGFGSLAPGGDGIYALGGGIPGLVLIPATDKAKAARLGPSCRSGRQPGDDSCSLGIVGQTPGAVWVQRMTTEGDVAVSVFERWDRATGEITISVPTEEILPPA